MNRSSLFRLQLSTGGPSLSSGPPRDPYARIVRTPIQQNTRQTNNRPSATSSSSSNSTSSSTFTRVCDRFDRLKRKHQREKLIAQKKAKIEKQQNQIIQKEKKEKEEENDEQPGAATNKEQSQGNKNESHDESIIQLFSLHSSSSDTDRRERIRRLFVSTLTAFSSSTPSSPIELAKQIESSIYHSSVEYSHSSDICSSSFYSDRIRDLLYNLRSNSSLCISVLSGAVTPLHLISLSSAQLADNKLKLIRLQAREENRIESLGFALSSQSFTDAPELQCTNCKEFQCGEKILSSRRDIGKEETWGSKDAPTIVKQLLCKNCGETWQIRQ
jgi:hypothetical protein